MRLIQISDPHLFDDTDKTLLNLNTTQSLLAVLDLVAAAEQAPDLIILSGDISQDHSIVAYQRVAEYCQRFTCPIYWLPGNHDSPEMMQTAFATTQFKEDKAILWGKWLLVLLNSHYPKHVAGHLSRSELSRLDYYLAQHPDQHALVFLHHHPVKVGSTWLDTSCLQNPDDFFAVTDKYPQVRGIICGHIHQVFETHRQNIPILSAPSTCIQFLPQSAEFALDSVNPGYRWFDLQDDGTFKTGVERLVNFDNTADFAAKGY